MKECPQCKKKSLKSSSYYPRMMLCFNKACSWYLKDDISKLIDHSNTDLDGFTFQRENFKLFYKNLKENKKIKINSSIIQTALFIIDFLKKENKNYIVIFDDDKRFSNISKVIKKHNFNNHISFIKYKDFLNINIQEKNYLFINSQDKQEKSRKIKKNIDPLANYYEIC
jgi:hypothetical protein